MSLTLHPLNPLAFVVTMRAMNDAGKLVPVDTGTVTAFLATSDAPTATKADDTLEVEAIYTGAKGEWAVRFPAAILTPTLLATLFADTPPYCILAASFGARGVLPLTYEPTFTVPVTP